MILISREIMISLHGLLGVGQNFGSVTFKFPANTEFRGFPLSPWPIDHGNTASQLVNYNHYTTTAMNDALMMMDTTHGAFFISLIFF